MTTETANVVPFPLEEPTAYELLRNCPSPAMQVLCQRIERVASARRIIITGESGVGKEHVAEALHNLGPRRSQRFVVVNCGSLNPELIESDFKGHVRGAYTGAKEQRMGYFQEADHGTLFLDELSEFPLISQSNLLRGFEGKPFRKVGGNVDITVDVAVIATTNRNLPDRVRAGEFRLDLYQRLNIMQIRVPPLRERQEDIPYLAEYFANRFSEGTITVDQKSLECLRMHNWPGNVRELEHTIQRAIHFVDGSMTILPDHLELEEDLEPEIVNFPFKPGRNAGTLTTFTGEAKQRAEGPALIDALLISGGNKAEAARLLGIDYKTYRVKLKKYKDSNINP